MQTVYRAKNLSEAYNVRELLASSGISVYIALPAHLDSRAWSVISVSVDNAKLDKARRAVAAWLRRRAPGAL